MNKLYTLSKILDESVIVSVDHVHDGDTIIVSCPNWPKILHLIPVRLYGIDAPELHDEKRKALALKAKDRLTELVGETVELRNLRRDKFFRILSDVYSDGKNLSEVMLQEGLVLPYSGVGKKPWISDDCDCG